MEEVEVLVDDGPEPDAPYEDDGAASWDESLDLFRVVGVRLEPGRVADVDAGDGSYARGDVVVVEREPGVEALAVVVVTARRVLARGPLGRVLRRADRADADADVRSRTDEARVARAARDAVERLGLPFKVLRADAGKAGRVLVWFAGDEKLPFLDLLRELAPAAGDRRLELRQIGPRDAAKQVGGVGPCGLQLCCNTFLAAAPPVTLRMAKDQGVPTAPLRVNGVCGRLLCCLMYEEAHYRAAREVLPELGEMVATPRGSGHVRAVDVLEMRVRVELDDASGAVEVAVADVTRRR
jgi:cell fate regulator YaaT (PSP1 superfamily)